MCTVKLRTGRARGSTSSSSARTCAGGPVGRDAEGQARPGRGGPPGRRAARAVSVERGRVGQHQVQSLVGDPLLQLGRGALGDHPAAVQTAMRSASRSASSRYWVVRKIGHPGSGQVGDDLPHALPAAQVEAGGRLVEEDHRGLADQAGREVEPAAHAAGVGAGPPAARPRPGRTGPAARWPGAGPADAGRPDSRAIMRRFSAPVCRSSTAAYCPVRLMRRRTWCRSRTTSKPATRAWPRVRPGQRGEDPHGGGLAGPVGPEQREHAAARRPAGRRRPAPAPCRRTSPGRLPRPPAR